MMHNVKEYIMTEKIDEMLKDYLHANLDILSRTINRKFNINEKICYNHAPHAKLSNHLKVIEEKYKDNDI